MSKKCETRLQPMCYIFNEADEEGAAGCGTNENRNWLFVMISYKDG